MATDPGKGRIFVTWLSVLVVCLWAGQQAWAAPTFDTVQFGFSNGPFGVAATVPDSVSGAPTPADINGDGLKPDLAVANADGSTISLFFNNGSGLSNSPQNLVGLNQPHAIALGDFDGNGKIDVAVTNFNASTVSVFFNDGGSSFAGPVNVTVGADPLGLTAGRFHAAAAYDDLAVVARSNSSTGGVVKILTTGGTRSFSVSTVPGPNLKKPQYVVVGHFGTSPSNAVRDANLDIAVTANANHQVKVYFGNGSGGFTEDTNFYEANQDVVGIAAGEFNNDTCGDLAVTNNGTAADGSAIKLVSLLRGVCSGGGGSFTGGTVIATLPATANPNVPTGVQLNGGVTDLAFTDPARNKLVLLVNNTTNPGFPSFSSVECATGQSPQGIAAGDFDHDLIDDLSVANKNSDTVRIFVGTGTGSCATTVADLGNVQPARKPIALALCDVTDAAGTGPPDSNPDILVLDEGAVGVPSSVVVFAGTGTGVFTKTTTTVVSTLNNATAIACGDLNADSQNDFGVTRAGTANRASFFCNQGNGTFASAGCIADVTGLNDPRAITFADLLADSSPDDNAIANRGGNSVTFSTGAGTVSISPNNAPVSLNAAVLNATLTDLAVAPSAANFAAFLFNNVNDTAGQNGLLWTLSAQGLGTSPITGSPDNFPSAVSSADLDVNAHVDVVTANPDQRDVTVLLSRGNNFWQSAASFKAGSRPNSLALADFDRNGTQDVAVADDVRNEVAVLSGNGCPGSCTSCSQTPKVGCQTSVLTACPPGTDSCEFPAGTAPQSIQAGNLNGDCKIDIAVVNPTTGSLTLLLNTSAGSCGGGC